MKILYGRKYMTEEELKRIRNYYFCFIGFLDYVGEV